MTIEELKEISTLICTLHKEDEITAEGKKTANLIIENNKKTMKSNLTMQLYLKENYSINKNGTEKKGTEIKNKLKDIYVNNREINGDKSEMHAVWFLVGINQEKHVWECLQVASACTIDKIIEEISTAVIYIVNMKDNETEKENADTKDMVTEKEIAHGKILNSYDTLEFYEVDINEYLKNENIPLSVEITDPAANRAKRMILAGWIEGKIACDFHAEKHLFHVSPIGVDKYSFEYYLPNRPNP